MSFSVQTTKGFMPVNCDDCGSHFWMKADKAQSMTAAGKHVSCRDCQIFKGFTVPPWPCARKLSDDEIAEMQVETQRSGLYYEHETTPPPPAPAFSKENTMTLAELREKLTYNLDVHRVSQSDFAKASGINQGSISRFCRGHALATKSRFKLIDQMEKRGWLSPETSSAASEVPATEPKPVPETPSAPTFTDKEKAFLIYAVWHGHGEQSVSKTELLKKLFPDIFPSL